METNKDGSKETPEEDKESEGGSGAKDGVSGSSKNSRLSDSGTKNLSMDSLPSQPRCNPPPNSPETLLEGEDHKEPGGPTLTRYKYDRAKEDHEELSRNLRESAMKTMIKMLELQAARRNNTQAAPAATGSKHPTTSVDSSKSMLNNQHQPSTGSVSWKDKDFETQLRDIEKQVRLSINRTTESRREQAHLMSLINNLEVKMYRTEEAEYIKDVMSKIPDEMDLEKMKRLQLVMMERKRLERDIQRLQMEIRAMNNAMASADVIVSECAPIKKPRRVVIREVPESNDECPSPTETRGHITSPDPNPETSEAPGSVPEDDDEGERKRSVDSENEVEINKSEVNKGENNKNEVDENEVNENEVSESEVKATPKTKGKKSKK